MRFAGSVTPTHWKGQLSQGLSCMWKPRYLVLSSQVDSPRPVHFTAGFVSPPVCVVSRQHFQFQIVGNVSQNLNSEFDLSNNGDEELLTEFSRLFAKADDLWETHQDSTPFRGYVSADYLAVYETLIELRGHVFTVLEWGSGLGIVTIMASRMGFDAYGIEAEPVLVEYSESLAREFGPEARFAQGSFIPDQYEWNPANGDEPSRTIIDTPSAYNELDMELRDFDLVYAYPWPDEHTFYQNIMQEFARSGALFVSYDAREGIQQTRFHDSQTIDQFGK